MAEDFNTDGMLEVYLFENQQLLEQLQDTVLEQKDADCFDEDSINEIFRTMHTIKGSSGIMMFDEITKVAHKLEDVFYFLRESHPENVPHLKLVDHVLTVADFISAEVEKIANGESADGDATKIVAELDKFLKSIKGDGKEVVKDNEHQEPKQFYIAPVASEASKFYKIYLTYSPGIELANIHAFKVVHSLKEIAEDLLYSPDDIVTNPESAEEIMEDGFKILLQTQSTEEELHEVIQEGYELDKVEIYSCTPQEFQMGFDSVGSEILIEPEKESEGQEEKPDKTCQNKNKKRNQNIPPVLNSANTHDNAVQAVQY